MQELFLLLGAGLLAGTMNAVAGGGSFVTLPALVFAGVPSVGANTSSTVALFPGSMASSWAFRDDFQTLGPNISMRALVTVSLAGSIIGALLLLLTSSKSFSILVPWLLLFGTLTFAFGPKVGATLRRRIRINTPTVLCLQFLLGIYGGYFGGAVGIMMMAVWSLLGVSDIKAMIASKALLVGVTNSIAVVLFIAAGKIWWKETCLMMIAAIIGGYVGARLARRVKAEPLRLCVSIINILMTMIFFYKTFAHNLSG